MKVIILRGVPGAGKSTWAKKYVENYNVETDEDSVVGVVSADHYFQTREGYRFDASKLSEAHLECFVGFLGFVQDNRLRRESVCIVDNCNTQLFEIAPYIQVALANGCELEIIDFNPNWTEAARRNIHGVPSETVFKLWDNFENLPPFWFKYETKPCSFPA
jgi:predicted kinase